VGEALVETSDALVRQRRRVLLGPVSLSLQPGEFVGVVGPNGAGKTTLLRILSGLLAPQAGTVRAFATTAGTADFRRVTRTRIGLLFQQHDFVPDLPFSVEDVVLFGRTGQAGFGRRFSDVDYHATAKALDALDLFDMRRRLYRELSGGERQKTHLARLLAQEADLLLLDEPAAGLDLAWQERLTALVQDIFLRTGRTLVMVTHEIDRLPSCCNRAVLIKDGRILRDGSPNDVFTPSQLQELYGCPMDVVKRDGRWHAFSTGGEAACCRPSHPS
jgi:ABC-type cobalamin/Fe3+-siderophores transport system ATPase subunit